MDEIEEMIVPDYEVHVVCKVKNGVVYDVRAFKDFFHAQAQADAWEDEDDEADVSIWSMNPA